MVFKLQPPVHLLADGPENMHFTCVMVFDKLTKLKAKRSPVSQIQIEALLHR